MAQCPPRLLPLALAACLLPIAGCAADEAAAPLQRPPKLGLCVACHGEDGRGQAPGQPHLGGQDRSYLRSALQAYRDGRRRDPVMGGVAGALSPADIDALADWYAAAECACRPGGAAP